MKYYVLAFIAIAVCSTLTAQELPVDYNFGEKYNDRYKYSNLVTSDHDSQGGTVLVRAYYQGLILKPKGYLIEHYNKNLELVSEYNYKLKGKDFLSGHVHNGQLYLIFLDYNLDAGQYEYQVHRSPLDTYNFRSETLMGIRSEPVDEPIDRNFHNRNFNSGFTTSILSDKDNKAFVISTHFKKGKHNAHYMQVYDASLERLMQFDFTKEVEEKNFAFENMVVSNDLSEIFIMGKSYLKKKRFGPMERKFQYELVRLSPEGSLRRTFDEPGKYSESIVPLLHKGQLYCVGFYSDRKNNRYNGISFFRLHPGTMGIESQKYNPFSDRFMMDKLGKETDAAIADLIFKNVRFTADDHIVFNAEEYFVTNSVQANSSGGRVRVSRFHHNDIVSVKLNSAGDMVWARNINKTEVTQGDGAYASYSSYTKDGDTYFFICTATEEPQLMANDRLIFKQGFGRNRNVFIIRLDKDGELSYQKIIDAREARLPFMVSKPLVDYDNHNLQFYAKRGNKKQLVNVHIQ